MMITSSNRYARASAAIQSGGPVLVGDEAHPDQAGLAAIAGRASGAALELLGAEGREIRDLENRPGGALARHAIEAAAGDLAGGGAVLFARVGLGGLLARDRAAERLASDLAVPFVTVEDVVEHRLRTETIVEEVAEAALPSRYAAGLRVRAFRTIADGTEHLALVHRPGIGFGPEPLVRLHSECLTGDALGSLRCDCGEQLRGALDAITRDPQGGAVLYLRGQEGRGIGLANKIRAYALQENGRDTVDANLELGFPADARDYGIAAAMLQALGIGRVRLLSNNPAKRAALVRYGIDVPERRELRFDTNPYNAFYLDTKRKRMGHDLPAGPRGDSR